jgi:hypothetical protein
LPLPRPPSRWFRLKGFDSPEWIVILGLVVAVAGELSWFEILNVKLLPLIPLTRFPGFVWMIAAGFSLSKLRNTALADDHIHAR